MNKRTLFVVLLLAVVLVGAGALYFTGNLFGSSLNYTVIENGDRQHRETGDYYTIQINYPNETPLANRSGAGAERRAQAAIEDALEDLISQFKQAGSVDSLSQEEKDRLNQGGLKYSLNVGYKPYSSGSFVSYEFDVFMDTGGAHPNNFYKTVVLDLEGNPVVLEDLFVSGSDYLERIAAAASLQVEDELRRRIGGDPGGSYIREGTAPKAENFEHFVVDSDRLRIFIPPYQAAAYAAGSFEVQVPLVEIRDILKPGIN